MKMNNTVIKLETLKKLRACSAQLILFKKLFGNEVEVTEELCIKYASDFEWYWAAEYLLPAPLYKQYEEATAPYLKQYQEANAQEFYKLYSSLT